MSKLNMSDMRFGVSMATFMVLGHKRSGVRSLQSESRRALLIFKTLLKRKERKKKTGGVKSDGVVS